MQTAEITIDVASRNDPVKLVLLGDLHLGNANTDEVLIAQMVERLKEDNTYWLDLGDACDFINLRDPRFDPRGLPPWIGVADLADLPAAQVARYKQLFAPVADRCLVRLAGNHEETLQRIYERDVYAELNKAVKLYDEPTRFKAIGVRALGYSGFLRLRLRRVTSNGGRPDTWTLLFFLHHGGGGDQLAGAKALRLERLPMAFDADIFVKGHTHTKMVLHKRRVGLDPRRLQVVDKPLIMINIGSFMRGELGGYAERAEMYPQGLGAVELWIWLDKRLIRVVQ